MGALISASSLDLVEVSFNLNTTTIRNRRALDLACEPNEVSTLIFFAECFDG